MSAAQQVEGRRSLPLLTNSAATTFMLCPRLYWYTYEELYRPSYTAEDLAIGTLGHRGLETWLEFIKRNVPVGQPAPIDALHAAIAAVTPERDPFRRASAEALIVGYHHRWGSMTYRGKPIEILAVEREFAGRLINPSTSHSSKSWQRGGKMDAIIAVDGEALILEHKVTRSDFSPGSTYRRALRMNTQIDAYHEGARILGYDVKGVVYDCLGKVGLVPLKATPHEKRTYRKDGALHANQRAEDETVEEYRTRIVEDIATRPEKFFARFDVVRLQSEEQAAAEDLWAVGEMIRDARRLSRFPRNPASCGKYGRECDFLPVCEGTSSLSDGTRYRRAERQHEELSAPEAA